jgi:hypothetical protein
MGLISGPPDHELDALTKELASPLRLSRHASIKYRIIYLAELSVKVSTLLRESVGTPLVVHLQLFNSFN